MTQPLSERVEEFTSITATAEIMLAERLMLNHGSEVVLNSQGQQVSWPKSGTISVRFDHLPRTEIGRNTLRKAVKTIFERKGEINGITPFFPVLEVEVDRSRGMVTVHADPSRIDQVQPRSSPVNSD